MMQWFMIVLAHVLRVAKENGGVVRPVDVKKSIDKRTGFNHSKEFITDYKVRQVFKELRDDGALELCGNHYVLKADKSPALWLAYEIIEGVPF